MADEQAIAAGKLDASQPIDAAALVAAGVLRRLHDGVRLLGKGELTTKLDITVYSATATARAAVEKAGGTLTVTKPAPVAETAEADPARRREGEGIFRRVGSRNCGLEHWRKTPI